MCLADCPGLAYVSCLHLFMALSKKWKLGLSEISHMLPTTCGPQSAREPLAQGGQQQREHKSPGRSADRAQTLGSLCSQPTCRCILCVIHGTHETDTDYSLSLQY